MLYIYNSQFNFTPYMMFVVIYVEVVYPEHAVYYVYG